MVTQQELKRRQTARAVRARPRKVIRRPLKEEVTPAVVERNRSEIAKELKEQSVEARERLNEILRERGSSKEKNRLEKISVASFELANKIIKGSGALTNEERIQIGRATFPEKRFSEIKAKFATGEVKAKAEAGIRERAAVERAKEEAGFKGTATEFAQAERKEFQAAKREAAQIQRETFVAEGKSILATPAQVREAQVSLVRRGRAQLTTEAGKPVGVVGGLAFSVLPKTQPVESLMSPAPLPAESVSSLAPLFSEERDFSKLREPSRLEMIPEEGRLLTAFKKDIAEVAQTVRENPFKFGASPLSLLGEPLPRLREAARFSDVSLERGVVATEGGFSVAGAKAQLRAAKTGFISSSLRIAGDPVERAVFLASTLIPEIKALKGLAPVGSKLAKATRALEPTVSALLDVGKATLITAAVTAVPERTFGGVTGEVAPFVAAASIIPTVKTFTPSTKLLFRTKAGKGSLPGKGRRSRAGRTKRETRVLTRIESRKRSLRQAFDPRVSVTKEGVFVKKRSAELKRLGIREQVTRFTPLESERGIVQVSTDRKGRIVVTGRKGFRSGVEVVFKGPRRGKVRAPARITPSGPRADTLVVASPQGAIVVSRKPTPFVVPKSLVAPTPRAIATDAGGLKLLQKAVSKGKQATRSFSFTKRVPRTRATIGGSAFPDLSGKRGRFVLLEEETQVVDLAFDPIRGSFRAERGGFRRGQRERLLARIEQKRSSLVAQAPRRTAIIAPDTKPVTVSAVQSKSRIIPQEKSIIAPAVRISSLSDVSLTPILAASVSSIQDVALVSAQEARQAQAVAQDLSFVPAQALDFVQALDTVGRQRTISVPKTPVSPRPVNDFFEIKKTPPIVPPKRPPRRPPKTPPRIPPPGILVPKVPEDGSGAGILFGRAKLTPSFVEAFLVEVKRRGMFRTIGSGLTEEQAISLGFDKTIQTLGATFRVRKTGKRIKAPTRRVSKPGRLRELFREFKIRKGQRVSTPGTFIQRRGKRLVTKAERVSIQRARKSRRRTVKLI